MIQRQGHDFILVLSEYSLHNPTLLELSEDQVLAWWLAERGFLDRCRQAPNVAGIPVMKSTTDSNARLSQVDGECSAECAAVRQTKSHRASEGIGPVPPLFRYMMQEFMKRPCHHGGQLSPNLHVRAAELNSGWEATFVRISTVELPAHTTPSPFVG